MIDPHKGHIRHRYVRQTNARNLLRTLEHWDNTRQGTELGSGSCLGQPGEVKLSSHQYLKPFPYIAVTLHNIFTHTHLYLLIIFVSRYVPFQPVRVFSILCIVTELVEAPSDIQLLWGLKFIQEFSESIKKTFTYFTFNTCLRHPCWICSSHDFWWDTTHFLFVLSLF